MATSKTKKPEVQVPPGCVTWVVSTEELVILAQLLSFAQTSSQTIALEAANQGDAETAGTFTARAELSAYLVNKIKTLTNIGEPSSSEKH